APALSGVYKLAGIEENGHVSMRIKLSLDKATYPGAKQVWRFTDARGKYARDLIAFADENTPPVGSPGNVDSVQPLLEPVMKDGCVIQNSRQPGIELTVTGSEPARMRLSGARDRAADERKRLPEDLLALDSDARYDVSFSRQLEMERDKLSQSIRNKQ